jgi:hypothetical protein
MKTSTRVKPPAKTQQLQADIKPIDGIKLNYLFELYKRFTDSWMNYQKKMIVYSSV